MSTFQCLIFANLLMVISCSIISTKTGCVFKINQDLADPQPLYLKDGSFWEPDGSSGEFRLKTGEELTLTCVGPRRRIVNPNLSGIRSNITVKCQDGVTVASSADLKKPTNFTMIKCSGNVQYNAIRTGNKCYGNNTEISVGFQVSDVFYESFRTCFNENNLEVLYAKYVQGSRNSVTQSGVLRPSWLMGSFYKDVNPNTKYKKTEQLAHLKELVGEQLAKKYMYQNELTRGHLAAKVDFVLATRQRATFFYINAVPQWSSFNNGNWNTLEENLRRRITSSGGNDVTIWSGSYDVTRLKDTEGNTVEYYLHSDVNGNNQIAVPKYFYKVLYDPVSQHGTAFIGINSVHSTMDEIQEMLFCKDICRNNEQFAWLTWKPDVIMKGYSFCCTIEDFNKTVAHLPHLTVKGVYV